MTKEAGAPDWSRGFDYAQNFVGPYWLYLGLPLAAVLLLLVRRDRVDNSGVLLLAPVLSGAVLAGYVVRVGGDWMQARMLLPALFMLLLPVLVIPATRACLLPVGLLAIWTAVALSPLSSPYLGNAGQPVQALTHRTALDVRRSSVEFSGEAHPISSKQYLREFAAHQRAVQAALASDRPTLVLFRDVGGVPTLFPIPVRAFADSRERVAVAALSLGMTGALVPLDQRVVDQLSLAYPLGAHLQLQRSLFAGHEKRISNTWIVADYTTPGTEIASTQATGTDPRQVAAARAALHCGQLQGLVESVRAPLTIGRFWKNLIGAPRRTALRIPRAPLAAERLFCGSTPQKTAPAQHHLQQQHLRTPVLATEGAH